MDQYHIAWEALEFTPQKRRSHWYAALWIAAVAISITSMIIGNYLFALFVMIGAITLTIHALKEPAQVTFVLSDRGLHIDDMLHPYSTLHSFWVEERGAPKLLVRGSKFFSPLIVMSLENVDTAAVRDHLLDYLNEEEHHEPLSHKAMEFLGF